MSHNVPNMLENTIAKIREMVDVNTVVGDPVKTQDGSTIIPISRISFDFIAGGGEYGPPANITADGKPFAGGAGAGVSVHPMGFLVCSQSGVRLLSASCSSPIERLVEIIPQALSELHLLSDEEDTPPPQPAKVKAAYREP